MPKKETYTITGSRQASWHLCERRPQGNKEKSPSTPPKCSLILKLVGHE
jgi:hypothetical protein